MAELVIRGATIVDGLGHEPRRADVAVTGGKISAIEWTAHTDLENGIVAFLYDPKKCVGH